MDIPEVTQEIKSLNILSFLYCFFLDLMKVLLQDLHLYLLELAGDLPQFITREDRQKGHEKEKFF